MKELLGDTSTFEGLESPPDKHLIFVINYQDKIKNILKYLHDKESLTDILYKTISLVGCCPGFYIANLRYTNLSLTIVHVSD